MNKHTNKRITENALNEMFLSYDNTINTEYLNHTLRIVLWNTEYLYNSLCNMRMKPHSVAFITLVYVAQEQIKNDGYIDYYPSNEQIKNWLFTYGKGYDELSEIINEIIYYRQELKQQK